MALFTRNIPYYHLLKYLLFLLKHPVYICIHTHTHTHIWRLSGKYPSFWIYQEPVAWPWCNLAASQRRPLLCIREQSLSRGASQSAVRRHWPSLCTEWLAFTVTERADQLHHDNAPAHSTTSYLTNITYQRASQEVETIAKVTKHLTP